MWERSHPIPHMGKKDRSCAPRWGYTRRNPPLPQVSGARSASNLGLHKGASDEPSYRRDCRLDALALLVTVLTSASAATGDFSYKFVGLDGSPQSVTLHDPVSPGCITLPESPTRALPSLR